MGWVQELELDDCSRVWVAVAWGIARPSREEDAVETGEAALGHEVVDVGTMGAS